MDTPWGGIRASSTLYWAEQLGQEICTWASQAPTTAIVGMNRCVGRADEDFVVGGSTPHVDAAKATRGGRWPRTPVW
jgi:hypothetical protein